ncbi:GNAT family N-acetyltransferase [Paenibacillus sp. ACRRX]|uniref:GNAT family N-acetyltransferase n=1 Tax=Paenibacillus sp. ACRRX TaxID=2918206 RepID=UPI001EF61E1A|nr:GNAT family N-acetyltransferase [Paenibacillus sp. ACRRX]MCG7406552.1 GNAT family N-acetyltransferase [Paenibacillus sp. ACRRX]
MHELAQSEFRRIKPLLAGGHLHPEIISIVEHNNPGWIFVDQVDRPNSALVWSKGIQGFYLIGDHTNEVFKSNLDHFIRRMIEPRMREVSLNHFEVSGHHDQWSMETIFSTRKLYKFEQVVLNLVNSHRLLKSDELETINLKTEDWENMELKNTEFIDEHLSLFWSSPDDFKKKGFGFAAVKGREIIGVCYSSFVTQDTHAIGIETVPHFQNLGVGSHLASLIVEEMVHHGLKPYWDCSHDNKSSKKLAERLGFTVTHRYTCSSFNI